MNDRVTGTNNLALIFAATAGNEPAVRSLLEAGADPSAGEGCAAVVAAENGHAGVLERLLGAGADVHAQGDLALREAACSGSADCVRTLLAHGADVHAENEQALLNAVRHGHLQIVKLLIEGGADVRARLSAALEAAVPTGRADVAKALVDAGARFFQFGQLTLIDEARRRDNPEMIRVLLQAGAKPSATALSNAVAYNHVGAAEALLQAGADASDKELMSWAIRNGSPLMIRLLFAYGTEASKSCAYEFGIKDTKQVRKALEKALRELRLPSQSTCKTDDPWRSDWHWRQG